MADISPYDVALREQYFYEGVRQNEANRGDEIGDEVTAAIIAALASLGITTLADLTKRRFGNLIKRISGIVAGMLQSNYDKTVANCKAILAAVTDVGRQNANAITGKRITAEAFDGRFGGNLKLWKQLTDDLIPGTGLTPRELIGDFGRAVINNTVLTVKKAWARKATLGELVADIRGTAEKKFRDGLAVKIANQWAGMSDTLLQYLKSWVLSKIGPLFYDRYQWVSTLDDRTTPYCQAHHLRIYDYGRGPIPPAHYRCRSTIVGIREAVPSRNDTPEGFASWFGQQPAQFLRAVVSAEDYARLASGNVVNFDAYRRLRAITAGQYARQVRLMQLPSIEE